MKIWKTVLRLSFLAVLLWFVCASFDIGIIARNFSLVLLQGLLIVQPVIILSIVALTMRYACLVGMKSPAEFFTICKAVMLVAGLNAVLPVRMSELLKPLYLKERLNMTYSTSLSAVVLEKLIDIIILGLISLISLGVMAELNSAFIITLSGLAAAVPLLICHGEHIFVRLIRRFFWKRKRDALVMLINQMAFSIRKGNFFFAFAFSLAAWLTTYFGINVFLGVASAKPFDWQHVLVVYVFLILGGVISIAPGGFGTYEAAAAFAMSLNGLSAEEAIPLAVVLHLAQLFIPLTAAFIITATEKISWHGEGESVRISEDSHEVKKP